MSSTSLNGFYAAQIALKKSDICKFYENYI